MSPSPGYKHPPQDSFPACSQPSRPLLHEPDHKGLAAALDAIQIINRHGYTALVVGGAVRDILLQRSVKDVDLATDMPLEKLQEIFKAYDMGKSRSFQTIVLVHSGEYLETTRFRGVEEFSRDLMASADKKNLLFSKDALHRDFTINAMSLDENMVLLDPYSGQQDIILKQVRGVQCPRARIREDPLRMLRGIRLACEFDFELEERTAQAMRELAPDICRISPERAGREIIRLASLNGPAFARGIVLMDSMGLLRLLLPEVEALKDLPHDPRHHPEGDVFHHTLEAIRSNRLPDSALNMALLAHDLGKGPVAELNPGMGSYRGHDRAARDLVRNLAQRLRLPGVVARAMQAVAVNHMRMHGLDEMRPSKILEMVEHPYWPLLARASVCDHQARGTEKGRRQQEKINQALARVASWLDEDSKSSRPVISGNQVMQLTGIPPGPLVGRIMRETTNWARDNDIHDRKSILEYARHLAREHQNTSR
ncbi:CCA tRNA nucleotidyltransferase [Desulfonatronospira sp.]|uniref:CCA tRNA nucleotidyltransferase n=1 Tax=Desulfonatronospira sp. TaxID=1962951 RepID=UPI0025C10DCC|nr:CCA tRNA nucleotidyltransferase [Desulfonatronospira sp.]